MDDHKIKEIEDKIAELKRRWPSHSVPPGMWQQLEEFEEELEMARGAGAEPADPNDSLDGGRIADGGGPADGR